MQHQWNRDNMQQFKLDIIDFMFSEQLLPKAAFVYLF